MLARRNDPPANHICRLEASIANAMQCKAAAISLASSLSVALHVIGMPCDALKVDENCCLSRALLKLDIFGGQIPDTVSHEHARTCIQQPAVGEGEIIGNQIRCFVESRQNPSLTTERMNPLKEEVF